MAGRKRQRRVDFRRIEPTDLKYVSNEDAVVNIGAGGFGTVKKAVWKGLYVAVKCFFVQDQKGGFLEELRGLTLLQTHKHIVQLLGAYNSSSPYIVMEYAPLSVEKVLHEKYKEKKAYMFHYKSDHVISWSHQMAVGLDYIHSKDVLHRDIKPSNLLLFNEGRLLKLCDFGTARKLDLSLQGILTNSVGTARYMAPEVIKGNKYNKSCDVFSFGIAVWEMLARKRPIIGKAANIDLAILFATATGVRPPKILGLPLSISDMIELCWQEPSKRPTMCVISKKLHYLCQFVDIDEPITDMTSIAKAKPLLRPVSVMYSQGEELNTSGDVQYDSLQEKEEYLFQESEEHGGQ